MIAEPSTKQTKTRLHSLNKTHKNSHLEHHFTGSA